MSTYQNVKEEVSFFGMLLRWGLFTLIVIGVLGFVTNMAGLWSTSYFAPKVEAVRYKTFQESQSYNEGMVRELETIRLQYATATPEQRIILKDTALHRFAVYPGDRLSPALQAFYASLQTQ